jgi:hypothetical protein
VRPEEFAAVLGAKVLYQWCARKRLRHVKVGRAVFICRSELDEVLRRAGIAATDRRLVAG